MNTTLYVSFLAAGLAAQLPLQAQGGIDLSGHWEGAIHMPAQDVRIEIDFQTGREGLITGSAGMPDEDLSGVVLQAASVNGTAIEFRAREDQRFTGKLAPGGQTMSGDFLIEGISVPFELQRTGSARIVAAARTADPLLRGIWRGAVQASSGEKQFELDIADSARFVVADEGGLTIRVSALTHSGDSITVHIGGEFASYQATLKGDELIGTFRNGALEVPLTLRRTPSVSPDAN